MSDDKERTYMAVHSMYVTLQEMEKDNAAHKNIIKRMVEMTLGAEATVGRQIGKVHGRKE